MKKLLKKVIVWPILVLLTFSIMVLDSPKAKAAADTKMPATKITLSNSPKDTGWHTAVTLVKLHTNSGGQIYFQWNQTDSNWTKYQAAFRAWRGENTLYYYSVNKKGVKESVKSQIIKVDYDRPSAPGFTATGENGQVKLSWQSQKTEEVKSYRILKHSDHYRTLATVSSKDNGFTDTEVTVGRTYSYALIAADQAGNISPSATAYTIVRPVIKTVKKEIKPMIDEKAAVSIAVKPVSSNPAKTLSRVKEEKVEKIEETKPEVTDQGTTEKTEPSRNWNRLLVAISILIIAAGAAVIGFYAYEWWNARREEETDEKKNNQGRW